MALQDLLSLIQNPHFLEGAALFLVVNALITQLPTPGTPGAPKSVWYQYFFNVLHTLLFNIQRQIAGIKAVESSRAPKEGLQSTKEPGK